MPKRKAHDHVGNAEAVLKSVDDSIGNVSDSEFSEASDANVSDNDENDSHEDTSATTVAPPPKKQKKQVTAADVQTAREAAELFKSNIFKLQIDELLKEMQMKASHVALLEKALHRLHGCILQVTPVSDLTLDEAMARFDPKKVVIPFPDPKPTSVNYRFGYLPPSDVLLVGAFGLKAGVSHNLAVDVVVTMPEELFLPKDYLNYRAFYKRSFYVAYLAQGLLATTKKNGLPVRIQYAYLHDDPLCPILKITSIRTDNDSDVCFDKTRVGIHVIVGFPRVFDSKKLASDRNCIRVQSTEPLPPTPYYNLSVLALTAYRHHLQYLYAAKKLTTTTATADAFQDACTLGRLWLHQRGLGSTVSRGGFGHFEFCMVVAALLGTGVLLPGFSLYQLFKGTVQYLEQTFALTFLSDIEDCEAKGKGKGDTHKEDRNNLPETPLLLDRTIGLNILWKMTPASSTALRRYAAQTATWLDDKTDRFDAIFLQRLGLLHLVHDLVYTVPVPEAVADSFTALDKLVHVTLDNYLRSRIYDVLLVALRDRAVAVDVRGESTLPFPLARRKPPHARLSYTVCVDVDAAECDRLVTNGPSEGDPAASAFKAFWGSRATLRRFKDGAIRHCVVWPTNELVPLQVIAAALPKVHPGLQATCAATYFLHRLPQLRAGTAAAAFTHVRAAFDTLAKAVQNSDLPLGVKAVIAAAPLLRASAAVPPVPFAVASPDFWTDALIQLESLRRWPDELRALAHTKSAVLLRIAAGLEGYRSYFAADTVPFSDAAVLHVLTPDGYGFRLRVATERDEVLYTRAENNAGPQRTHVQRVHLAFRKAYDGSARHTRSVAMVAARNLAFLPTVRLFKQWLDAHCVMDHTGDELAELLAMQPFVDPAPYAVPGTVAKGFLQILRFLATWNWKDDPLLLDVGTGDAPSRAPFDALRARDPLASVPFFVATRDDPLGVLWTHTVLVPIASRITALARAAMHVAQVLNESAVATMFTPVWGDFDFHIRVRDTAQIGLARAKEYKNLVMATTQFPDDVPSAEDPARMFAEALNRAFGNVVLFSARRYGALFDKDETVIGGVFLPLPKKKFRVSLGMDVQPAGGDEVMVNKQDVYDQIALLGGDLVKGIKKRKEKE